MYHNGAFCASGKGEISPKGEIMSTSSYDQLAEQLTQELLTCGLSQSDFRLIASGYGSHPLVVWTIPLEQQMALAEKLAERLHVSIHYNGQQ